MAIRIGARSYRLKPQRQGLRSEAEDSHCEEASHGEKFMDIYGSSKHNLDINRKGKTFNLFVYVL